MENVTIHGRSAHQMRRLHNRAEKEAVKEAEKRRKERLIFWLLAAAICVMRLWYIRELHAPFLLDDEIGYWSHAANLAGLSWTGTETLWYSYGYSLLLAPLFLVSHNMEVLYRLAVAENALLGVLSFWAGFHLILELDEDFDRLTAMFISFVAASYSAYIFQSSIAWAETFVYAWFLVTALQAVRFCKRPTYLNTILLTLAAAFLYIIHNRTLAIWIALLLTLFYMLFRHRISWKHLALTAGILAVVYAANLGMKEYLTTLIWGAGGKLSGNSVSSQSGRFALLTSFAGIRRLLYSLAGKIWYLLSSTLLVGYLGMVYLLKSFAAGIMKKQSALCMEKAPAGQKAPVGQKAPAGQKTPADQGTPEGQDSAALFLMLSVLGTVALATLTTVPKIIESGGTYDRLDVLFYGRYSDMISGLLILTGLMYLYQAFCREKSIRSTLLEIAPGLLLYGICFAAVQTFLDNLGSYVINIPCVPGVFFLRFDNYSISFIRITVIAAALFFLILLGFLLFRRRLAMIGAKARCVLVGFGMTGVFLVTSWNGFRTYTRLQQSYNYTCYSEATEILNANTEFKIYSMDSDHYYVFRQHMRVTVVDGDISYGTPGEEEENYFLIGDAEALETLDFTAKQYYYIMTVEDSLAEGNVYILAVGDEILDKLESEGYVCGLMTDASDAGERNDL